MTEPSTTQRDELALFLAQRDAKAGNTISDRAAYEEFAGAILAVLRKPDAEATR